ncbi:TRAP transporter substrate-binding protein [Paradesulfitobacterium ferrireducens]|uniref:TRAP transporter substrate-binding protein n=1 Tax=Paradesulfitobacterium ferrireducens TaxID=2816476 RepID=UPI001A8C74AC|nr:TRAP transporter substrate-binding protein [Paradesulfitobacterium ferrireducens]
MNRRWIKIASLGLAGVLLMGSLAGCGTSGNNTASNQGGDKKPEFTLKFGHVADENNSWHKAALYFADEVKKKSNGRIEVKVYPNSQLGSEMDTINGIQAGTADMTITGESLQNWAPKVGVMGALYLIKSDDQLKKVADGPIGKEIEQEILDKTGLRPLTWFARGPRYLTSNRPIKTPDDLNGLRLRVPNVPLYVKAWEALGAKPTPMALGEVFTGLQQGTVDAQENPLALIQSSGFYEVQKYINRTEHVRSWIYVVIGNKKFESMPKDLQQIVLDAAKDMQTYEHDLMLKDEQALTQKLQSEGMQFVDTDQAAFEAKAKPAILSSLNPAQKDIYEKIMNTR